MTCMDQGSCSIKENKFCQLCIGNGIADAAHSIGDIGPDHINHSGFSLMKDDRIFDVCIKISFICQVEPHLLLCNHGKV